MGTLVVVTGGSAGLGRALLAAAPSGAERVDVSRSGSDLPGVTHLEADLADPGAWAAVGDDLAARIAGHDGDRITVIHNAGTLDPIGFAGEVDGDQYTAQVLLTSAAPQVLGHRVLTALADHPAARRELVLLSSGSARTAYPGWSAYGAGKAAVDQWVRTVALEQADRGAVRVLAVVPGVVATAMQEAIRDTAARDFPAVGRFQRLHDDDALIDPDDAATRLWALLDRTAADPELGPIHDLRG